MSIEKSYKVTENIADVTKPEIPVLDAYTDEELEQALARVLAHARGEVLNDAEVQKFWQLCKEIQRRRALSCDRA